MSRSIRNCSGTAPRTGWVLRATGLYFFFVAASILCVEGVEVDVVEGKGRTELENCEMDFVGTGAGGVEANGAENRRVEAHVEAFDGAALEAVLSEA